MPEAGLNTRASVFAILLLAAQTASAQPKPENHRNIRKPSTPPAAVKGIPYSGEMHTESTAVAPDGTRITRMATLRKEYRDAQGRTRREEETPPEANGFLRIVTIDDLVAGVEYVLEPAKKIAHRFKLEPSKPGLSLGPPDASAFPAKTETLEPKLVHGMRVDGVRRTITVTGNSARGRGPSDTVLETWTASDLQIVILETTSTIDSETTTQMTDLRLGEQPAALFQVQPDYRIEDELNDFVIDYPLRGRTSPPSVISRVTATYTGDALSRGIQGTVRLSVTIEPNGRPRDIKVERSLDPSLDQQAMKAVSQWRFEPAKEQGRRVGASVFVEVNFSLNQ